MSTKTDQNETQHTIGTGSEAFTVTAIPNKDGYQLLYNGHSCTLILGTDGAWIDHQPSYMTDWVYLGGTTWDTLAEALDAARNTLS
jgi:hypothetical protein